jgi:hypothetical protein
VSADPVYFFAYGIELERKHFQSVCPGARAYLSAVLPNYRLKFGGWNRLWRSSTANLQGSQRDQVKGGLYIIRDQDLPRIERTASGQQRLKVRVFPDSGPPIDAVTFVHGQQDEEVSPSPEYLERLRQGYREWGLD